MSDKVKALPCPFCGSESISAIPTGDFFQGICLFCEARGGKHYPRDPMRSYASTIESWNDRQLTNTLPRNADRYTVLNIFPDEAPAKIAACKSLGLEWFAEGNGMNRVNFYVFLDEAGLQNYRDGLYNEDVDSDE